MLFVFHLKDRPEAGELRKAIRPAHKEYLARVADRICVAGPLLSDDPAKMIGSLLVIDFPSRAAADAWLTEEPFTRAGVYEASVVTAFQNLWPQRCGVVDA
ncbi:MAG: YciI family protein [Betaproteobacteria bacterium]